jgi:hypothetical protein
MTPGELDVELANVIVDALHLQRLRWEARETLCRPEELSQSALNVYLATRPLKVGS